MLTPDSLFLYTLLATLFGGAAYFAYTTWAESVAPKKPKRKFETPKPAPAAETPDASGAKYQESWIPEHHLKRPGAKKGNSKAGKKSPSSGSE